ncbi:hypothetical protein AB395_00005313 (plasmid) [Sinorhizobium fredii CCBAU 45436]|nr:hypothetical protein AB395_00005313 [Sinorhizobium fredii CCBAU 45436]
MADTDAGQPSQRRPLARRHRKGLAKIGNHLLRRMQADIQPDRPIADTEARKDIGFRARC